MTDTEWQRVTEVAQRRGFFFQSFSNHGEVAGFYTYGPHGTALKNRIESIWRERFSTHEGHMEIDAPTIMPEAVFEASGHLDGFDDMIVTCPECGEGHRADHLVEAATGIEDAEALSPERNAELIAEHDITCPACGSSLVDQPVTDFSLMFGTTIGPGSGQPGYLRPETAQGIFVDFPRLREYARNELPFGVTQLGKVYRNEINPRLSLIRMRELNQAELEHFIDPERHSPDIDRVSDVELTLYSIARQRDDAQEYDTLTVTEAIDQEVVANPWIAFYLGLAQRWFSRIGIDMDRFRYRQHLPAERAHYASDCWDAEALVNDEWVEITGFAYRSDYDLAKHAEYTGERFSVYREYDEPIEYDEATLDPEMSYFGPRFGDQATDVVEALEDKLATDQSAFEDDDGEVEVEVDGETVSVPVEECGFSVEHRIEHGEQVRPHIVEPSFGVDRLVSTVLAHAYREDEVDGEDRRYLALDPEVAPVVTAVLPLRDDHAETARSILADLRDAGIETAFDDSGSIGRRYRRQDEIGTPICITVDDQTGEDDTVTLRDRDTTDQIRVQIDELTETITAIRDGEQSIADLQD